MMTPLSYPTPSHSHPIQVYFLGFFKWLSSPFVFILEIFCVYLVEFIILEFQILFRFFGMFFSGIYKSKYLNKST